MLESMGLAASLLKRGRTFAGVRIIAYDGSSSLIHLRADDDGESRPGLVIPRRDLDDALRLQAISAGVRFLSGVTTLSPSRNKRCLVGLCGRYDKHPLTIEAQLLVVATGANRTLVQALGLSDKDKPEALALRAYLAGLQGLDDYLEIYLDRELLPGYAWVFPIGDGTANVGVGLTMMNGMNTPNGNQQLRAAFDRLLRSSRLSGGQLLGRPQGYPLRTDFPAVPTYASGVLVVGEAAGLVDPVTGEGIGMALESGQLAAEVASEALRAGDLSGDRLRRYDDVLRDRYASYFEDTRELMVRLAHPKVLEAVVQKSRADVRIRDALITSIVDERPRDGIVLLGEALRNDNGRSLARSLFIINAYRPLIDQCRTYMLAQVSLDTPSLSALKMVGRGKMLRALLVFLGCQAAGGDPVQVLAAAAGIELVHAASLIHDDIMDNANTRRGLPALHTMLGMSRAIVIGDYLIAKAFRLLAESRTTSPAVNVVEAFIIGAESGIRACTGQFQDVGSWAEERFNEEMYDRLMASKTAAAIAGALKAGAALAGGDKLLLEALARYGECVGRAFQIRDDLLDFANVSLNGCSIDRRPTLPLIHAFQHSDDLGRKLIWRFLKGQEVSGSELAELLQETGSLAHAEAAAYSLTDEAVQLAKAIPQIQEVLEAIAHYAIMRNR